MVDWFSPVELGRTGIRALLAEVFGSYADKRELQAALHQSTDTPFTTPCAKRVPECTEMWLDYVADVGDGFNTTFSVAWLLSRDELEVEGVSAAGEVLVELGARTVERLRGAQDAWAELAGQPLELRLRLGIEADAAEPTLRDADEQPADGRVLEQVVGDVELAGGGCGRPEALVENCGDCGHRCSFSFRSRRTPAEAA